MHPPPQSKRHTNPNPKTKIQNHTWRSVHFKNIHKSTVGGPQGMAGWKLFLRSMVMGKTWILMMCTPSCQLGNWGCICVLWGTCRKRYKVSFDGGSGVIGASKSDLWDQSAPKNHLIQCTRYFLPQTSSSSFPSTSFSKQNMIVIRIILAEIWK